MSYICPVCKEPLFIRNNSYICNNNHCFDISKKGYVNLLLSKGNKTIHGDDKEMIRARCDFLDTENYKPLCDAVCELITENAFCDMAVLDCGCGECYYTARIYDAVREKFPLRLYGIDISKEAVTKGHKRNKEISLAVASVFHLPFSDNSFDLLITMFSPFCKEEYLRVLKPGGYLLMAIPLEEHLWEIKQAVYDTPYKNSPEDYNIDGLTLIKSKEVKYIMNLRDNHIIKCLFDMTPYKIKTSPSDRAKLDNIECLDVTAHFGVLLYKNDKNKSPL